METNPFTTVHLVFCEARVLRTDPSVPSQGTRLTASAADLLRTQQFVYNVVTVGDFILVNLDKINDEAASSLWFNMLKRLSEHGIETSHQSITRAP